MIDWPESISWRWMSDEIARAASEFAAQLRQLDGATKVPNLEWDVRELAAHVAALPGFCRKLNAATEPFKLPESFPAYSKKVRAHLDDVAVDELAQMIADIPATFLPELGDDPRAPYKLYVPTRCGFVGSTLLSELLLHGKDLAALTGATVTMTNQHALALIDAIMVLAPTFVDEVEARKRSGTFHLHFRGGRDYTYEIADGALAVSVGRPARADARLSADPLSFVLVALGRKNPMVPALTGKMIAYGRAPWKLMALDKLSIEGI